MRKNLHLTSLDMNEWENKGVVRVDSGENGSVDHRLPP